MHSKLQDKMRCNQHGGSFCYVEPGTDTHIRLSSADLGIWAMAIINEAATMSCPPRTIEFERILHPKKRKEPTLAKPAPEVIEIHEDPVQANKPIIHYHMLPPAMSAPTLETPKKKRRYSRTLAVKSSPIPGFEVREYNSTGLYAFLEWCTNENGDYEYLDAYESLAKQKLGLDLILAITPMDLCTVCQIPYGTALRIIHFYPKWLLELKSAQSEA